MGPKTGTLSQRTLYKAPLDCIADGLDDTKMTVLIAYNYRALCVGYWIDRQKFLNSTSLCFICL